MTEWRDIPGFENRYQVSDEGELRSIRDPFDTSARRSGRVLKAPLKHGGHGRGQGYRFVNLRDKDGVWHTVMIHRAVALTFLGAPQEGEEVRHLDGDALNNRVENLAWGTHQENVGDTIAQGRHGRTRTEVCENGHPRAEHANEFGQCRTCKNDRERAQYWARKALREAA